MMSNKCPVCGADPALVERGAAGWDRGPSPKPQKCIGCDSELVVGADGELYERPDGGG